MDSINQQIQAGSENIVGVMIESHLVAGNQSIPKDRKPIVYGQSITDACVGWETTETMLHSLADAVAAGRPEVSYNVPSVAGS